MALARGGVLPVATAARPPRIAPSTASARQAPAARQQPTGRRPSTAAAGFLAAAAVVAGARRRRPSTSRRPGRRSAGARVALRAYEYDDDEDDVGTLEPPTEQDLKEAFLEASGGTDTATLDETLDLEGIDDVIAEGAITEEEMEVMWGDEDKNFEEWKEWYMEVFYMYDDFLTSSAVAPPAELMEDVQEELDAEDKYTDEELLEDSPTRGISVKQVISDTQKRLAEEAGGVAAAAQPAAAPQQEGNFDVARLFKEGCDEDNLLSFDSFTVISDINDMLDNGEVTYGELKEMWAQIPQKSGSIDVMGFKTLMKKVDDLFEYDDEEEENKFKNATDAELLEDGDGLDDDEDEETEVVPKAQTRPIDLIKANLKAQLQNLEDAEKKPMGLDGTLETDPLVSKLAAELEDGWRSKIGDIAGFDEKKLLGDWELLYSTSLKYRRWQGLMNSTRFIKDGVPEALTQTFEMDDKVGTKDYDVEEILIKDGREVGIRAIGSWELGLSPNVVTGLDDIVIKLLLTGIEFDKTEDEELSMPEEAERKLLQSQMVRTFSYTFLTYMDDEIMVCRSGYTSSSVFIFQRMGIEEE